MGKAVVLTDQDFSQKNLGRVTFTVSNEELATSVATAYCTAIGDNSVYDSIFAFVLGLANAGLWNKMKAIYPMYGDTLTKLSYNLITPGTNDLIVGANASPDASEKAIDFVRNVGTGDVGAPVSLTTGDFSFILGFKAHSGTGTNTWFAYLNPDNSANRVAFQGLVTSLRYFIGRTTASYTFDISESSLQFKNNLVCGSVNRTTGGFIGLLNGEQAASGTIPDVSYLVSPNPNRILGQDYSVAKDTVAGETISNNQNLADGTAFFYAIGELTAAEVVTLNTLATTHIITEKGITLGA